MPVHSGEEKVWPKRRLDHRLAVKGAGLGRLSQLRTRVGICLGRALRPNGIFANFFVFFLRGALISFDEDSNV